MAKKQNKKEMVEDVAMSIIAFHEIFAFEVIFPLRFVYVIFLLFFPKYLLKKIKSRIEKDWTLIKEKDI